MTRPKAAQQAPISEKAFQQRILDFAHLHSWLAYHTHDSRRSAPGFPDLVLVRGPTCLFLEVKRQDGTVEAPQQAWIDALKQVRYVHADIVRPEHEDQVLDLLATALR